MPDLHRVALAMSDPIRLQILDLLGAGRENGCCSPENPDSPHGVCACDLRPHLDEMAPSKLAYHLNQLRDAELITEQKRGRWVYYSVNRQTLTAFMKGIEARYLRKESCAAPDAWHPVTWTETDPL